MLANSTAKSQTQDHYYNYVDPYWKFQLEIPDGWIVTKDYYGEFKIVITNPDYVPDPMGNPVKGSSITINIEKQKFSLFEEYINERYKQKKLNFKEENNNTDKFYWKISGYNEALYPFQDRCLLNNGYVYCFSLLLPKEQININNNDFESLFSSLNIIGTPEQYPAKDKEKVNLDSFVFNPLLFPYYEGPGRIISDYHHDSSIGQEYAFDFCTGQNCSGDTTGFTTVIVPTDLIYRFSFNKDNIETSLDMHIFEIANNGTNRLCLLLGHFDLGPLNYGLVRGDLISMQTDLGTICEYNGVSKNEHVHFGMYSVSSQTQCEDGRPGVRTGIPFNQNPYSLDGNFYYDYEGDNNKGPFYSTNTSIMCFFHLPDKQASYINKTNTNCYGDFDSTPPSGRITSPVNGAIITNGSITINANAIDNTGGSGIALVRFTANWPGSTYSIIGRDYSYPYSITWDMCGSNVPDGPIELDIEVEDNDGNLYVFSDYYTKPVITKSYTCGGGGGGNCPTDGRDGVYLFADQNFAGDCYYSTVDVPNLGATPVGNDRMSSVRIIGDYETKLYEDINYGGRYDELNESDPNLDIRSLGDQYSSVKIYTNTSVCPTDGREGVYMYSDINYLGDCLFSTVNIPFFGDTVIGDNDLSSIRYIGHWDAKIYKDANYEGPYEFVGSNDPNLNIRSLGGQYSSAKLIRNNPTPTPTPPPNQVILLSSSINNGGFETASMSGWTSSGGTFVIDTANPHSGWYYVKGTSATEAKFYRYFDLTQYQNPINDGRVSSSWRVYIDVGDSEQFTYIVRFLDVNNNVLYSDNTGWSWHDGGYDDWGGHLDQLPANTAKAYIEFKMRRSTGDFTDCDVDDFYLDLFIEPEVSPTPTPTLTPTVIPDCFNTYPTSILLYDYSYCSENAGILPINVTKTLFNLSDNNWNNKVSSLKIPDGWSMVAYEEENGVGAWVCLNSSNNDLSSLQFPNGNPVNNNISSIVGYNDGNCPRIEASNFNFEENPLAGETVTASFRIKNISGRTLNFDGVLAGVHGPFCETWNCSNISDFPWSEDITLANGETYLYSQSRAFYIPNDQYLLEFLTLENDGEWKSYLPTSPFEVLRGIEIIEPVTLTPPIPFVGQEVNAQFTIKNFGNRTITIPHLMVIAKGPNCESWDCPEGWADYPWVDDVTLYPGEEYHYSQTRPFYKAGNGFFADTAFGDNNVWWYLVPNNTRYNFYVFEPFKLFLPVLEKY